MDGLAAIVPGIDDEAIAVGQTIAARKFGRDRNQMAEQRSMLLRDMRKRCYVLLRNEEQMCRRLRIDVRERYALIVLMKPLDRDGAGHNLAEEAVWILCDHVSILALNHFLKNFGCWPGAQGL